MNPHQPYHIPGDVEVVGVPAEFLLEAYLEHVGEHLVPVEFRDMVDEAELPPGQKWAFEGKYELWSPNGRCLMSILDFAVVKDFETISHLENMFTLEIILQGHSEVHIGERSISNNGLPRIYLASHGADSFKKRIHKAGDSYRSLGIWISPTDFLETFGVDVAQLATHIQSVVMSPDSNVVALPMTQVIKDVANEALETPFQGKRAEQYLKAKFTELLCHVAELTNTADANMVEAMSLPRGKANALKKVMLALEQSRYLPLSLSEIADELGLCAATLSSTFKQGYGMKLSEYLLKRRMEEAQKLLRCGQLSVLEVALEVGYENQSSFGRAYRQFFNHTPRSDLPQTTRKSS